MRLIPVEPTDLAHHRNEHLRGKVFGLVGAVRSEVADDERRDIAIDALDCRMVASLCGDQHLRKRGADHPTRHRCNTASTPVPVSLDVRGPTPPADVTA